MLYDIYIVLYSTVRGIIKVRGIVSNLVGPAGPAHALTHSNRIHMTFAFIAFCEVK